jgi:hypothetical protein
MDQSVIMRELVLNRAYKDYAEGTVFKLLNEFYNNSGDAVYIVKYGDTTLKISAEYLDELSETDTETIPKRIFTDEELKRIKELRHNLHNVFEQKKTISRGIEKIEHKLNYFINRCDHDFINDSDDPGFFECRICGDWL